MPKPHPTVDRVVTILEAVAGEPGGISVSALARRVGVPKSTAHTLVQGLLSTDFLEEQSGLLSLGPGIDLLASARGGYLKLRRLADEELAALAADTDETVHMSIRSGDSVIIIAQVESTQPIRYSVALHEPRPLLTTSSGKLFLADLELPELERFLAERGESTSPAADIIRNQRDDIRDKGIARNIEESVAGVCTIGAAVRGATDAVVAALVVAGPAVRVVPKLDQVEPKLRDAADRLSARLKR